MAIARGTNVAASYEALAKLRWDQASLTPATSSSARRRRRRRPAWQVAAFALGGAVALTLGALLTARAAPMPTPAPVEASVLLESDPPGAFIFVKGEPTGRVTPATLAGLDPAAPLVFRLEKLGHEPASGEAQLKAGAVANKKVKLVANQGVVRFTRLPRGAVVRVGDQVVLPGQEVILALGPQEVQVVMGGRVTDSRPIVVSAGAQEIPLNGAP
jgi:hypothetical protein